ncbi:lipase member H-like [Culicoides brevitarsis]|uniref:lipase member H-like n=1 Tax=Culicoides brevitarsis TaxID=469753 RepID=UPI00307BCD97
MFYTSKNWNEPEIIEFCNNKSLLDSNFKPGNPVRILFHGYHDGPNAVVNTLGLQGYKSLGEFNVIIIDWSKGANTPDYILAVERIFQIGPFIAEFIEFLLKTFKNQMKISDIYLIGHSLGAHLAGIVGKNMKSGKIPVIYGLDPAGPLFSIHDPDKRLDKNDAEYVEVIHTDGGMQGFSEPLGTADFYPNWGVKQPGCGAEINSACNHVTAAYYWGESLITEKGFWGHLCDSYENIWKKNCTFNGGKKVKMGGEPGNKGKAKGIYYVKTANQKPFALGDI